MFFDIIKHMSHRLAIITVVYQNYIILDDFFDSLCKNADVDFQLYIIDLSEQKKSIIPPSQLKVQMITGENKGYAHGVNLGIKKAIQDGINHFCIVNSDIIFSANFVQNVKQSLSDNPHSIIGGKIYYAPGYEYHKTRYQKINLGKVIWYAGGKVDWKNALTPHRGVDEVDKQQFDKKGETEFVNGCLMCFDKSVVEKVGLWNENYFLYFEDSDYCKRAKRKNIKLVYNPKIVIWHKNSQSTDGSGSKLHQKYQRKNQLIFGLKYAPLKTKLHLIYNYCRFIIDNRKLQLSQEPHKS